MNIYGSTISGVNISSIKKFLKYCFGDFVYQCKRDPKEAQFNIIFRDKLFTEGQEDMILDIEEVKKFKEFFKNEGVTMRIVVFKSEDIDQLESA